MAIPWNAMADSSTVQVLVRSLHTVNYPDGIKIVFSSCSVSVKKGWVLHRFDSTGPLVFTHMDLHPSNLILGDDGQLWIIDWGNAGWYPKWFEAASMTLFAKFHPDTPVSWTNWIPFVAGSCEKPGQLPFIRAIGYSLECMPRNIMNLIDSEEA